MYKSYISFVKFVPKYFILIDTVINGIYFFNFIFRLFIGSVQKCNWFYTLILYLATFLNLFVLIGFFRLFVFVDSISNPGAIHFFFLSKYRG